jgi:hypothetical protein
MKQIKITITIKGIVAVECNYKNVLSETFHARFKKIGSTEKMLGHQLHLAIHHVKCFLLISGVF